MLCYRIPVSALGLNGSLAVLYPQNDTVVRFGGMSSEFIPGYRQADIEAI
jgi:hypothetical protein